MTDQQFLDGAEEWNSVNTVTKLRVTSASHFCCSWLALAHQWCQCIGSGVSGDGVIHYIGTGGGTPSVIGTGISGCTSECILVMV